MDKTPMQIIVEAFCTKPPHHYCISFASTSTDSDPQTCCPLPYLWHTHSPMNPNFDRRFFNIYEGKN